MIKQNDLQLAQWYKRIIHNAELADYSSIQGDIVICPYGFAIWQNIINAVNQCLISSGHQQAYFPLFIPEKLIKMETNILNELKPKVFTITEADNKLLSEHLIVRPTSETIVNFMFSKWIHSYRDLPIKLYQWSNIARWEERTHPFIKSREILWLEGHTVHSSHNDALQEIDEIKRIFISFFKNILAIPVVDGKEPSSRKFVGSESTYTLETITPNGKSIQLAAIYDIGQIFSKIYNVIYRTVNNKNDFCWGTNWGLGFRIIGAIILLHGDERGLRLPPLIAPTQVVILPICVINQKVDNKVLLMSENIHSKLQSIGIRSQVTYRKFSTIKRAIEYWEVRGIPIIIFIGEDELKNKKVTVIRRDKSQDINRSLCDIECITEVTHRVLNEIQNSLRKEIEYFQYMYTTNIDNEYNLKNTIDKGWCIASWCGKKECENFLTKKYGKIIRLFIKDIEDYNNPCFICKNIPSHKTLFAKSF